ncbi:MAG: aspartate aminotransferase family protein [Coriobacteriales bacterium]|nr:aspartate aminotransferase family protein [Coriobacteriales bacterium]
MDETYVMQTYGRKAVEFVRGEGMRLYDSEGNEYLDFIAGIGAVSVGHAHPQVTAALQQQAAKLLHVSNYYYVEGRGELAQKLNGLLNATVGTLAHASAATPAGAPAPVPANAPAHSSTPWHSFFANSGTEAVEGAIKLARKYGTTRLGGATTIVSAWRSFHGRTLAALAATGQPSKQEDFAPLPAGFVHVELNDTTALAQALDNPAAPVCAVLLECIQGEGGVWPCTAEYLRAVREETQKRGILLIIDEVQTGFYRTGTYPFAFQHYGIVPDVVTVAKGMGNGVPVGAFCAHGAAGEILVPGDHGSTFGGSPLVVAAANATLDALAAQDCATNAHQVGAYLQQRLATLPLVTQVRGKGLMVGVALASPVAAQVVDAALAHGLVLNSIGPAILRFLPPLICTIPQVDTLIDRLTPLLKEHS